MPREGVPYPGREICSLKCQIDALNAKINELMKSINGVQGDGQGDLTLVSGDPAIVINNDQAQHEIEISLDSSQLPAADVSSVNGQTGVVDLDGADIPLNPGQSTPTVQNAVAANAGNISQLQADLNQEILDRGNADSALSTAINAALATIPGEVSSQIANDATINQLVAADAQNVKLTGAQAISGVKTVPTEATGSATQQIANSAKMKNELDAYAPMVRTTGNQSIAGVKTFDSLIRGRFNKIMSTNASNWTLLYKRTGNRQQWFIGFSGHSLIIANIQSNSKINTRVISNNDRQYLQPIMKIATDSNGVTTVWGNPRYTAAMNWQLVSNMLYSSEYTDGIEIISSTGSVPVVGNTTDYDPTATYVSVTDSTDFEYIR